MRLFLRFLSLLAALIAVACFWWPAGVLIHGLFDPGTRGDGIPSAAWSLHRSLAPRVERWATERVSSDEATQLSLGNISGTEWPLFGSVFYLVALENLQAEWEKNRGPGKEPRIVARGAIEAAARLVADPKHAHWVKMHWGDSYLQRENLFYRMLLITAFTAHERLLGTGQYKEFLREQAVSLARELDESPAGFLDDYPDQCFPVDVIFATRAIRHADAILGTDHSAFVERQLRAFRPGILISHFVDDLTGATIIPTRGCGTSPFLQHAADLWPQHAPEWEKLYHRDFWQRRWWAAGYREYARPNPAVGETGEGRGDVDSGPVIAGFSTAGSAFGIGASRAMGDTTRARILTLEALSVAWPAPGGGLLLPRIVSDIAHAPLLGECGLLYTLTQPARFPLRTDPSAGPIPGMVWMILALQILIATWLTRRSIRWWRAAGKA